MSTLGLDDVGKTIAFQSEAGRHVEGTIRAITHGVFSNPPKGEIDVPRVGITVYAYRDTLEHHWAKLETLAEVRPKPELVTEEQLEYGFTCGIFGCEHDDSETEQVGYPTMSAALEAAAEHRLTHNEPSLGLVTTEVTP